MCGSGLPPALGVACEAAFPGGALPCPFRSSCLRGRVCGTIGCGAICLRYCCERRCAAACAVAACRLARRSLASRCAFSRWGRIASNTAMTAALMGTRCCCGRDATSAREASSRLIDWQSLAQKATAIGQTARLTGGAAVCRVGASATCHHGKARGLAGMGLV